MSRDRIGGLRESMWMGGTDSSLIKGLGYEEHTHRILNSNVICIKQKLLLGLFDEVLQIM